MITLNDYLYSGDTIFKVLQNYITDLREDARKTKNEIDLIHCNFLIQIRELLEHNEFLTTQSQQVREFYKYMTKEYPYLALIKNYKNQFICEKCAEKVNPDRVRSKMGNDEKTV